MPISGHQLIQEGCITSWTCPEIPSGDPSPVATRPRRKGGIGATIADTVWDKKDWKA